MLVLPSKVSTSRPPASWLACANSLTKCVSSDTQPYTLCLLVLYYPHICAHNEEEG